MKISLVEGAATKQFEKDVEMEMDPHIKHLEKELLKIRTGRAHPSMIEDVKVTAYGALMPLREIAAVSAPDVALLLIQPWDKANIGEIEKALSGSDLGLTPNNDGNVIRIQLPRMSSSRREELAKLLNQKVEQAKVAVRNARKEVQNLIRETEKGKKISEDYGKRLMDSLQKITDKMIEACDSLSAKKEAEIKSL